MPTEVYQVVIGIESNFDVPDIESEYDVRYFDSNGDRMQTVPSKLPMLAGIALAHELIKVRDESTHIRIDDGAERNKIEEEVK